MRSAVVASTRTCWEIGTRLLSAWNSEDNRVSSRETPSVLEGSSVLRLFSRNASITFQMSTLWTETNGRCEKMMVKVWWMSVKKATHGWPSSGRSAACRRCDRKQIGCCRSCAGASPGAAEACWLRHCLRWHCHRCHRRCCRCSCLRSSLRLRHQPWSFRRSRSSRGCFGVHEAHWGTDEKEVVSTLCDRVRYQFDDWSFIVSPEGLLSPHIYSRCTLCMHIIHKLHMVSRAFSAIYSLWLWDLRCTRIDCTLEPRASMKSKVARVLSRLSLIAFTRASIRQSSAIMDNNDRLFKSAIRCSLPFSFIYRDRR